MAWIKEGAMYGDLELPNGHSLGPLFARKPTKLVVVADGATLSAGKSASFLRTGEWHRQVGRADASLKLGVLLRLFTLPLLVSSVVFVTSDLGSALNPLVFIICSFVGRPQRRITALAPPPMLVCFFSLEVGTEGVTIRKDTSGGHPESNPTAAAEPAAEAALVFKPRTDLADLPAEFLGLEEAAAVLALLLTDLRPRTDTRKGALL
eukprot:s640_g16.t1